MTLLSAAMDAGAFELLSRAFSDTREFFWQNPLFAKETWEPFTKYVRIFLALGGGAMGPPGVGRREWVPHYPWHGAGDARLEHFSSAPSAIAIA